MNNDKAIHIKQVQHGPFDDDIKIWFAYRGHGYTCDCSTILAENGTTREVTTIQRDESVLEMGKDMIYPLERMQLVYAVTLLSDGLDGITIDKRLIR